MADGVTVPIDFNTAPAEAKAKRLKDALDGTGKSWAKSAAEAMSRVGGDAGAGLGRALGGMANGFSLVAAAAAAAGIGLNAYLAASGRAVQSAKEQVDWEQKKAEAIKRGAQARAAVASGGLSQVVGWRSLMALGGGKADVERLTAQGVEHSDALQAAAIIRRAANPAAAEQGVLSLFRTGMGASDAARQVVGMPVVNQTGLARALAQSWGGRLTPASLANAANALDRGAGIGGVLDEAQQAGNRVAAAQADDLLGGSTGAALNAAADATLGPTGVELDKVAAEARRTAESLAAAAKAQWSLAGFLSDVGRKIGIGDGSERSKYRDFTRNSAAVRQ